MAEHSSNRLATKAVTQSSAHPDTGMSVKYVCIIGIGNNVNSSESRHNVFYEQNPTVCRDLKKSNSDLIRELPSVMKFLAHFNCAPKTALVAIRTLSLLPRIHSSLNVLGYEKYIQCQKWICDDKSRKQEIGFHRNIFFLSLYFLLILFHYYNFLKITGKSLSTYSELLLVAWLLLVASCQLYNAEIRWVLAKRV